MKSAPKHSKHLISIHQPQLWVASGVVIILVTLFALWSAYEYGRHTAGFDQSDYDQEIEILRKSLDEETSAKEKAFTSSILP